MFKIEKIVCFMQKILFVNDQFGNKSRGHIPFEWVEYLMKPFIRIWLFLMNRRRIGKEFF